MVKNWIRRLRYILIVLTAVLGLLGLSSSFGGYTRPIGVYGYNPYIQSYDINLTRTGNPLTQVLGYTKQVFVLNQYNGYNNKPSFVAWWRGYNGIPYVYSSRVRSDSSAGSLCQGYIKGYYSCPLMGDSQTDMPLLSSCSYNSVGESTSQMFGGFFKSLTSSDYYYFHYYVYSAYSNDSQGFFCVSSTALESSLCWSLNNGDCDSYSGSLGFVDLDFDNLNTAYLYNPPKDGIAPGGGGGGGGGGSWGGVDKITNNDLIKTYENMGYNKNVCYAGIWSGNTLVGMPGTGFSVFDLYETHNPLGFTTVEDWYNYYRNGFIDYPNIGTSGSVFRMDGVFNMNVYSLFAMNKRYGLSMFPTLDILEYCELKINADSDPTYGNQDYEGELSESEKNFIYNHQTVVNYYNDFSFEWSGAVGVLTGFSGSTFESGGFDFFKDLSKRFNNGLGQLNGSLIGIIPNYILVFMFALIFIRILRK